MSNIDAAQYRVARQCFDALCELPEAEQIPALNRLTDFTPETRQQIEAWLNAARAEAARDSSQGVTANMFNPEVLQAWLSDKVTEQADALIGQTHQNFRLLKPIGHGGMGQVFLAERTDGVFNQRVAIKLLQGDAAENQELLSRFRTEREILAALKHPNIAQMIDGGLWSNGTPFLAMEYVDGQRIDLWCEQHDLGLEARLALILDVCAAVQAAHAALIVHRDLKPANILVDQSGSPKLLDFGIAKVLGDSAFRNTMVVTQDHARLMTLRYASPEQVNAEPVNTASDVYALGVILYELLTGLSPYAHASETGASLIKAICDTDPTPPSLAWRADHSAPISMPLNLQRDRIGPDLDAIVLKALRKNPSDRYSSVDALRDDLQRLLDGRPVLARQGNVWYRTRKFIHRNLLLVGSAAVILMAVSVTAINFKQQRDAVVRERDKAQQVTQFFIQLFEQADPNINRGEIPNAVAMAKRGLQDIQTRTDLNPEVRVEMLATLCTVLVGLADFPAAIRAAELGAQLLQQMQTPDPLLKAKINAAHALALVESSEIIGSKPAIERLLADLAPLPKGAPKVLLQAQGFELRAKVLFDQENYTAALADADRAIAGLMQHLGYRSIEQATIESRDDAMHRALGRALQARCTNMVAIEDIKNAEPLCWSVMRYREKLLPANDPALVQTIAQLANVYEATGDLHRMVGMTRKALEITQAAFGNEHPNTGMRYVNLGVDLRAAGKLPESLAAYQEGLRILLKSRGDLHPHTLMVKNNLANLYYSMQQYDQALALHTTVQAERLKALPANESDHEQSLYNLAKANWKLGRYADAQSQIEQAYVRGAKRLLGQVDRMGLQLRLLDAQMAFEQGQLQQGLNKVQAVRKLAEARLPDTFALSIIWSLEASLTQALHRPASETQNAMQQAAHYLGKDTSRDLASPADIQANLERLRSVLAQTRSASR